jgi:threonine dehydratase
MITEDTLILARQRIAPFLKPTPLQWSKPLQAWLKLETEQPTNSFKVRPAFNGILAHLELAKAKGVLASSSGNFAQAVAFAAKTLGVNAMIVMPSITSEFKINRTRELGAEVLISGPSFKERWALTEKVQKETGRHLLHPYDSVETIAGDGTLALELLDSITGPFCVVVPVSGGGLISGITLALKLFRPECRIIGVQPERNGSMRRSIEADKRVNVGNVQTIADALVASMPGERTFEVVKNQVDELILLNEDEIKEGVRYLATNEKLTVEPGGAIGVAAKLADKLPSQNLKYVFILSGGNISPSVLKNLL